MANILIDISNAGNSDRRIIAFQNSTASIDFKINAAVNAAGNQFRATILKLNKTAVTNPDILLTYAAGTGLHTLQIDTLSLADQGHYHVTIDEWDGATLVKTHPHTQGHIRMVVRTTANPEKVTAVLAAATQAAALLNPARTFIVSAEYTGVTDGFRFDSLSGAMLEARVKIAASGGRVNIVTHHDSSGNPIVPALSNVASYTPAVQDQFIDVRSATANQFQARSFVSITALLEGPFAAGTTMNFLLDTNGNLPEKQPYGSTWFASAANQEKYYPGAERLTLNANDRAASGIASVNIVDWVIAELRTSIYAESRVARAAFIIDSNGSILDQGGQGFLKFPVMAGKYYLVIRHRNHLSIMSAAPVTLSATFSGTISYSFATGQAQAYGSNPMSSVGPGVTAMYAGDFSGDDDIGGGDVTVHTAELGQLAGYYRADVVLDGDVDAADLVFNTNNTGKATNVPKLPV